MLSVAWKRSVCVPRRWYSKGSAQELVDKFWTKISVDETPTHRAVTLEGKPLKTPGGNPLLIPNTKPAFLSHLIAQEWQVMPTLQLKAHHVPLTSLASRAIDISEEERVIVAEKLLPYLDTDTLLVIAPVKDCEGRLRADQLEKFGPVVEDACKVWGIPKLNYLDTESQLFGNYQTPEAKEKVMDWIKSLDNWKFASLERATTAARSLIVGMNTVLHRRPVAELAHLASLEVAHQTEIWGEVEDTHDVDHEDIRRLLGACYINALD